jgi:hypothetical protein
MFHAKHSIKAGTHSRRRFCGEGLTVAMELDKKLARNHDIEVTLIIAANPIAQRMKRDREIA